MTTKQILLAVLSFIIWPVGLILWYVNKEKEAETAKYCLYGAGAALVLSLLGWIF